MDFERFYRDNSSLREILLTLLNPPSIHDQYQMANPLPVCAATTVEEAMHEDVAPLKVMPGEFPSTLKSLISPLIVV